MTFAASSATVRSAPFADVFMADRGSMFGCLLMHQMSSPEAARKWRSARGAAPTSRARSVLLTGPHAGRAGHVVQSMITLPESPERAAAKAASKSRKPNRWVIAGRMSSPDWISTRILYQVSYISRP